MKKIYPFRTLADAVNALDNGGSLFHIFAKARDGEITRGEVGKMAGFFSSQQNMVLFLSLSISRLTLSEQEVLLSKLDSDFKAACDEFRPLVLHPSTLLEKGKNQMSVILRGVPHYIDASNYLTGSIFQPFTSLSMLGGVEINLMDMYEVYELEEEGSKEKILITHSKGFNILPEDKVQVAGVLKELEEVPDKKIRYFLEVQYYM